jgi:hypothetical protein
LQQQLARQAEEIAALKKRLAGAMEFPVDERQRFAATATAMGLSYSQTEELMKIVVKKTPQPSEDRALGKGPRGEGASRAGTLGSSRSPAGDHRLF